MQFCGNYEEKQKGSALKNAPAFQGSGQQHVPKEERPVPPVLATGTFWVEVWPRIQQTVYLSEYLLQSIKPHQHKKVYTKSL